VYTGNECLILEKVGLAVTSLMEIDEFEDYLELPDAGSI
jgi:hypothetical protein